MPKQSPTSLDVARLAEVSRSTVSHVLNRRDSGIPISPATRDRVLEAARQLGYYPNAAARSLRRQRAGVVGLAVHETAASLTDDAFLPHVIRGIGSVFGQAGLKLIVEIADANRPDPYVGLIREGRVDGMIFASPHADDDEVRRLLAEGVPLVRWGGPPGSDVPAVDIDNVAAGRLAVDHLLGLGHRRIACITNEPPETATSSAHRLRGYRAALEGAGLAFDERLVRHGHQDAPSGDVAMRSLLAEAEPPSAVFVASDEVAFGALGTARSLGIRIPHDLALVGFDDLPTAAYVQPPLTTIHVSAREIGATAARMFVEILETGRRPDSVILPTELVVRESCGARLRQG